MKIELEDGERVMITTNHGVIFINPDKDLGTQITLMAKDEHTLRSEAEEPIENTSTWIVPKNL